MLQTIFGKPEEAEKPAQPSRPATRPMSQELYDELVQSSDLPPLTPSAFDELIGGGENRPVD